MLHALPSAGGERHRWDKHLGGGNGAPRSGVLEASGFPDEACV